ncbi:MAG: hypothetical protein Q9195_007694 [Heterodermia aff. obscurata]
MSQLLEVARKAEQRLLYPALDADDLRSRLELVTPPPDLEEDAEECRVLDAQARKDLEEGGCPPCYPSLLEAPVRDPPEEYRSIIEYWESEFADGAVLCAQRQDWQKFRWTQERARSRYRREEHFNMFLDRTRKRRRKYGLDGDVHLLVDLHKQSQQQNWIEFENFHLKRKERWEEERDMHKILATSLKFDEHPPHTEFAVQNAIEYFERKLQWHDTMLRWIGQQRVAMDPHPAVVIESDGGDQNVARKASKNQRQSTRSKSRILGKAKISKTTPKSRNLRIRMPKASKLKTVTKTKMPDFATSTRVEESLIRRETKPRRAKETAPSQLSPQRVSRAR